MEVIGGDFAAGLVLCQCNNLRKNLICEFLCRKCTVKSGSCVDGSS